MAAKVGVDFLVKVNTGTAESPVYTTVGGQKDATLDLSASEIDASDKTTGGWTKKLVGLKEWSIELDGNFDEEESGFQKLEEKFLARETVLAQLITPSGRKYQGLAVISKFSLSFPQDGAASFSGTLNGADELEVIEAGS